MANLAAKFIKDFKSKDAKHKAFMLSGALALAAAIVGVFLPVVPQVPFAILAAYLFSKGSPRLHRWIRRHKQLGPPVKDWEDHRAIKPKIKAMSCVMMAVGAGIGHWKLDLNWALALDAVFAACIVFVLTRKSRGPLQSLKAKAAKVLS